MLPKDQAKALGMAIEILLAGAPTDALDRDTAVRIAHRTLAALGALVSEDDALAVQIAQVAVGTLGGGACVGEAYVIHPGSVPGDRLRRALQALVGERENDPAEARKVRELAGLVRREVERVEPGTPEEQARSLLARMTRAGFSTTRVTPSWLASLLASYAPRPRGQRGKRGLARIAAEIMVCEGLFGARRGGGPEEVERQEHRVSERTRERRPRR